MKITTTRQRQGFTLLEMMIAVGLFSICTAMAMGGFARVINTAVASVKCSVMHRELRTGLAEMSRDVMESKSVHEYGDGNYFALQKQTSTGTVTIFYLIYNKKLYRIATDKPGSRVFGSAFDGMKLKYYDLNGNQTTILANAAFVNLNVGGKVVSRKKTYLDAVETRVRLRNKQA